ncbi:MAG: nitroreductase family protein [Crenarchaeota archaeon]|nr:nitroreductase family protein [Thermoproteota archaeon]MCR8454383.1 nitroreductase family protein [Thermoproteota archaeon]MCR8455494.1 nitroreductase family protein [Thermoproteota archaeon]MCR8463734.1 nitroreductase family protein [Thermoproteota archaeon]MCR8471360.1 nitroreductase family protein [Thermoproteota archaeon]
MACYDVLQAITERRSIRKYRPDKVDCNLILKLLEAARWTPSAKNAQPWEFIIVDDKAKIEAIAKIKGSSWIASAPILIVAVSDPSVSPVYHMSDTAMALHNISLAALKYGLGTCWIGMHEWKEVKELLKIPPNKTLVGALAVGYPDEKPPAKERKPISAIAYYNEYGCSIK